MHSHDGQHDEERNDPRAHAVRRIVADLLGEADAAEREQLAVDLAADPTLAAERARLAATLGLVREYASDADAETLSPEAAARLRQAAAGGGRTLAGPGSARRPWYAKPLVFRAAAGFVLALGAFALWQGSRSRWVPAEAVVTADAQFREAMGEENTPLRFKNQSEASRLQSAGETIHRFDAGLSNPVEPPQEAKRSAGHAGMELEAKDLVAAVPEEPGPQSRFLGLTAVETAAMPAPSAPASSASTPPATKAARLAEGEVGRRVAAQSADRVLAGSDEFHLGRGESKQEADARMLQDLRGLGYVGGNEEASTREPTRQLDFDGRSFDDRISMREPAERARSIEVLLAECRRRPNEHPRDMFYRWWGDNAFEFARTDPLSTFAADVDTASYTLARNYLAKGILPTKEQIRTEEFVNYFKGDVPAPTEETFAVSTELAPSPFQRDGNAWTLRVALRGREVSRQERQPLALTFVVDVSGSMKEQNRLELVKHALRLLVGELDARDALSIVAFTNDARLVLPMTSARHRGLIESAIHPLRPEGGTNVQAGLRMGYEAALAGLAPEAHNRVVLLSDGVGNIGETDAAALSREVESARQRGVWLNTIGVGMGNHNDAFLEQLADKGDGICNYIDDEREARRALVENFTGAFEPIARDVKIQVEFDPSQVERYRLLGYENRAVADRDFRNDRVDAGEIGAGHQVTALYEVVRTGSGDGPLATVRVRWKPAGAELARNQFAELPAREAAWTVDGSRAAGSFAAASPGFRRSVLVGQLAEVLRRSIHARDDSLETLLAESRKLAPELSDPDFDEFVAMVERTIELVAADWSRYDDLARRLDQLRMQHYLKARLEDVARDLDRARIEELDGQIRDLEAEIRRELEREPERFPKSKVR